MFGRYPDYMRLAMWVGLGLYFVSIFFASFATQVSDYSRLDVSIPRPNVMLQVWQLILLQGVTFGISGGLLYVPVIKLLPEWFHERRGLAGGIIFAGGGVGGQLSLSCYVDHYADDATRVRLRLPFHTDKAP